MRNADVSGFPYMKTCLPIPIVWRAASQSVKADAHAGVTRLARPRAGPIGYAAKMRAAHAEPGEPRVRRDRGGAGGRDRTGTGSRPTDFRTTSAFAAAGMAFVV